jgi:hypothetical protein
LEGILYNKHEGRGIDEIYEQKRGVKIGENKGRNDRLRTGNERFHHSNFSLKSNPRDLFKQVFVIYLYSLGLITSFIVYEN